jgi:endonuclease/exonuclease/phosphatase (EEP) superfamily protein YafD
MSPRLFARLLLVGLLAGTLCAETTPEPSPSVPLVNRSTTITAAFWNIQWFPGRRPNASRYEENRQIRAVHRDLGQLNADIIGMEEVRDSEYASVAVQSLSRFKVDVCSNFPPREGQQEAQQIAIASRLQPISAWAEAWKPGGVIMPPRGFAFAAYQLSPKQVLLVYVLHLKSNRGEIHEDMRIREESIHQLILHMKAMKETYSRMGALTWIVGGDFNTTLDEPRFAGEKTTPALLADGFSWAWQGIPASSRITMPADLRFPAAAFDQIFYRGATLVRAWVTNTSPQSSDHRAVNVVLNVR